MPEVTLKAIEELLDLKLDEKLEEKFNTKLEPIQRTLNDHTTQLNNIARDVKSLLEEKVVTNNV